MSGGSKAEDASSRLGLPLDLIQEAEGIVGAKDGIYPDNWQAVSVFCDMSTQWRVGVNGATGLDYAALPAVLNIRRVNDREDVFECLRVMERAALREIRQK